MSKEGIPAVYEVVVKEHLRHIAKTAQDRMPVAERPRVIAAIARRNAQKEQS